MSRIFLLVLPILCSAELLAQQKKFGPTFKNERFKQEKFEEKLSIRKSLRLYGPEFKNKRFDTKLADEKICQPVRRKREWMTVPRKNKKF